MWLAACVLARPAVAQTTITGEVRDSVTQAPLPFASVFLANTTRGTTTDEAGRFQLSNVPEGSYDVIVSYLGYRLATQSVLVGKQPVSVQLRPAPVSKQLAGVVIRARRHRNRPEDYQVFADLLLGRTSFSRQCRIRNPDGVRVDFDMKSSELTAEAPEYLQVDNFALGYRIRFYGLHLSYQSQLLAYYAWPVFEELPTRSAAQRARWAANRRRAYFGSLTHFLRCVRTDRLAEEGFVANRLRRVPNPRWVRADSALKAQRQAHAGKVWYPNDSLMRLYSQEPQQLGYLYTRPLPADSLRRVLPGGEQVQLYFPHLTQVTYSGEQPDPAYTPRPGTGQAAAQPNEQISVLHLIGPQSIISPSGQLQNPLAVFTEGYWGFEKVGELLPFDYEPALVPVVIGGAGKKE
ncbi:hypothetical protein B0919_07350 [Hymenobacter sp. CRA2]|nr:hypothetical protein B0919_07350 [Hymenobacter sp. CRA2]